MIGRAAPCGWLSRGLQGAALAVLLMFGPQTRARAAEPEPPSKEFLEYLGTIEVEDDDWTIFDSTTTTPADQKDPPSPPKKEKSPTPQSGDKS